MSINSLDLFRYQKLTAGIYRWIILVFLSGLIAADHPHAKASISILFIGNSLTYTNNLPKLVEGIRQEKGVVIKTQMLAYPDYALEDHWKAGELQRLIKSNRFKFLVVQQGPSSQAEGRAMLLDYGRRIKDLCLQHHVELAFFMVWPARSTYHTFSGVIKNYTDAAAETNSILCSVGSAWKQHMDATGDFSYYSPDLFHPSEKGSKVAAEIIYNALLRR